MIDFVEDMIDIFCDAFKGALLMCVGLFAFALGCLIIGVVAWALVRIVS